MSTPTYEFQSDFARRFLAQGKAEGEAKAILTVLAARGVEVPDAVRAQIAGSTDPDQLGTWIQRAATATTLEDLFG